MRIILKEYLKQKIHAWWHGKPEKSDYNPVTEEYIIHDKAMPPHWSVKIIKNIFIFIKNEWKFLLTILFTILNFIYSYSIKQSTQKDNEKYKSCEITQENKSTTTVVCLK